MIPNSHPNNATKGRRQEVFNMDCVDFRKKSNPYSTHALNQRYEALLESSSASEESAAIRLQILQLRDIYLPRLLYIKSHCGGHYLCSKLTQVTTEALIAVEAIERAVFAMLDSYLLY